MSTKENNAAGSSARAAHPPISVMVTAAITGLQERGGSSLHAIKKYITANYQVDAEKKATYIKKYLKVAVDSGVITQAKGNGASGSFKITKRSTQTRSTSAKPKSAQTTAERVKPKKANDRKEAAASRRKPASPASTAKSKKTPKANNAMKPSTSKKTPKAKNAMKPSTSKKPQ